LPRGRSFPLEFAFTGENNDQWANNFEIAARYPREWSIVHPLYGTFNAQPMNLEMNNSGLESTIIKVQVIETVIIENNILQNLSDALEKIKDSITATNKASQEAFFNFLEKLADNSKTNQLVLVQLNQIGNIVSNISKKESELKELQKWLTKAENEINTNLSVTLGCLVYVQNLIDLPAKITTDIGSRINALENVLSTLILNIEGVLKPNYLEKLLFNLFGASTIVSICNALTIPQNGDFQTKKDVLFYIDILQNQYNKYLTNLYNYEDSEFNPDFNVLFNLYELVEITIFNLYSLLFSAKQERIYYSPCDTNLILLAHRLLGSASDENIMYLKEINKIGLSEILNIKKDRQILYYI
jgi:hypothetical protein